MQKMSVRIGIAEGTTFRLYNANTNGYFTFPRMEDLNQFVEVMKAQGKRFEDLHPGWVAWDVLRKAGWISDGNEGSYIIWLYPETDVERLELALKHHDWSFEMSDDHRVWVNGQAQREEIQRLMNLVGDPIAQELYDKYAWRP